MREIVAGLAMTLDGVVESPQAWMRYDDEMADVINTGIAEAGSTLLGRTLLSGGNGRRGRPTDRRPPSVGRSEPGRGRLSRLALIYRSPTARDLIRPTRTARWVRHTA